jgi:hypothetical protein
MPSPDEINEISVDRYQDLARAALAQIRRPDYPADMIPWLGEHHPSLYHELTCSLPDEIHRLWTEHVPLTEFQEILELWLMAHRTACELRTKAAD